MKSLYFLVGVLMTFGAMAQTGDANKGEGTPLFTEAESDYIDKWFAAFVQEMELSKEVAMRYQEITSKYSAKMDSIDKDHPGISKAEAMEQFNTLMQEQHLEIKTILTTGQYEMYYDTMKKVVWSINQRLKQL